MTSRQQLICDIRYYALHLYIALEMRSAVQPVRNEDEALQRLCLHAREYYERYGGLPVHIVVVDKNGNRQVFDVEDAPVELLQQATHLVRDAADSVWRHGEWRCRSVLSTLEHSCDHCVVADYRDASVVAEWCTRCNITRYGVGKCCTYDFGVSVYFHRL